MRPHTLFEATAFAAVLFGMLPDACGQRLSVGVVAGGSLTDSFQTETIPAPLPLQDVFAGTRYFSSSKDYLVGPMVEWRFTLHWSLEVDRLYRKLHFTSAAVEPDGSLNSVSPSPVVTWEFPVLAKYRFQWSKTKPFVELGPSFRTAGNLNGTNPSHRGVTASLGVEMRAWGLTIAPALRYTRWAPDGVQPDGPKSSPNQLELVVGVSGAPQSDSHPLGPRFSGGVMVGVGLTDGLRAETTTSMTTTGSTLTQSTYPVKSVIAGAMVELALPRNFSVEVDAMYRPLRSETVNTFDGTKSNPFAGSIATWELPVLAKYRFSTGFLRPFIEAGPAFRLPAGGQLSNHGVTAGAGVEAHLRVLKIAPEVRYTHWAKDNPPGVSGTIPNQAELLVGLYL
jgi:hypothetical protein